MVSETENVEVVKERTRDVLQVLRLEHSDLAVKVPLPLG